MVDISSGGGQRGQSCGRGLCDRKPSASIQSLQDLSTPLFYVVTHSRALPVTVTFHTLHVLSLYIRTSSSARSYCTCACRLMAEVSAKDLGSQKNPLQATAPHHRCCRNGWVKTAQNDECSPRTRGGGPRRRAEGHKSGHVGSDQFQFQGAISGPDSLNTTVSETSTL